MKECKTKSPDRLKNVQLSVANLRDMTNPELKALAKHHGYRNYGKLNKGELVRLLVKGALPPQPKYIHTRVKDGVGVPLDQLFTAGDESPGNEWVYGVEKATGGFMISGVDLKGMFGAEYRPPGTVTRIEEVFRHYDTDDDTDDEDEQPVFRPVTRTVRGGWFVNDKAYAEVVAFLESLRQPPQPKSLQELAMNVVAARKIQKGILPKQIVYDVKVYRKTNNI